MTASSTSPTIKAFLDRETRTYLRESGVLPDLSALPSYDVHDDDDIAVPRSLPSLDAVRTFFCIANLRGCRYGVQKTDRNNKRITYYCKHCKATLTFSLQGDAFRPTARSGRVCGCPRVGRSGNKRQKFPRDAARTAIAALYESGVSDILGAESGAILGVLGREWGFREDEDLATRVKEEFVEADPLRRPENSGRAAEFLRCLGCRVVEDGAVGGCFVAFPRSDAGCVWVLRHLPGKEDKGKGDEGAAHYAAFVAGEEAPFAWGSAAAVGDDGYGWFLRCLGEEGCAVSPAGGRDNAWVREVFAAGYNAFGIAYALYSLSAPRHVPLTELLRSPTTPQQCVSPVISSNNNNITTSNTTSNSYYYSNNSSGSNSPNVASPVPAQPLGCIYNSGSEASQQQYFLPQPPSPLPPQQFIPWVQPPQEIQGVVYFLPADIDSIINDSTGNTAGWWGYAF